MPNRIIAKVYPSNEVYASDSVLLYGNEFDILEIFQSIHYATAVAVKIEPFNPEFVDTKLLNYILHERPVYPNTEFNLKWLDESYTVIVEDCAGIQKIGPNTNITLVDSISFNFSHMNIYPEYFSKPANEMLSHLGRVYSNGFDSFLVTGPRGVGKTTLVKQVVSHSNIPIKYTRASDLIFNNWPKTQKSFKDIFKNQRPLVIVIDDIDELFEIGGRLMPTFMNDLYFFRKSLNLPYLCMIGISSRETLIPIVNREVLFKNVVNLELGDYNGRRQFLHLLLDEEFPGIAQRTKGYSPSDMENLVAQALIDNDDSVVTAKSLEAALESVKPANLSGSLPKINFCDLYGMETAINQLEALIVKPFNEMEKYLKLGVTPPRGVLLHGPSGNGKTSLAIALSNSLGMPCIYSANLRSKYVGDSEKNITKLFATARNASPSILLIDQIIGQKRSTNEFENSNDRITTTFLTEMDGIFSEMRSNVFVIAVCQDIEMIDAAILRPGRIDVKIKLSLPDRATRIQILQKLVARSPNDLRNDQIELIIDKANINSTADIIFLYREAAMDAIRKSETLTLRLFESLIISSEPDTVG